MSDKKPLNKTLHYKKALIEALEASLGVVTTACKKVGVTRRTYYDYYNSDSEFRTEVDSIQDIALDFAESKLLENIKNKKETSIIFYLKTKGRKRGYIEKMDIESTGKKEVVQTIVISDEVAKELSSNIEDEC